MAYSILQPTYMRFAFVLLSFLYSATSAIADEVLTFEPIVDARGFIDVWQLRHDVALVPDKIDESATDYCYSEGDPESEGEQNSEQMSAEAAATESCINDVHQRAAEYEKIFASFNSAWLPVMAEAIRKGDMVAEVILRHCDTTPAFDRTGIETTCDAQPEKSIAIERLNEIGFTPALNICSDGSLPRYTNVVAYPRAFTFYRTGAFVWKTDSLACISLHREPLVPGYLVWGKELYYGGGNSLYTGLKFHDPSKEEVARAEAEIERYIKQDPRWSVFLLTRIGRHEWEPAGTKSTTHMLDSAWEGVWELEKGTYDWTKGMTVRNGHAVISRDGEFIRISISTAYPKEPMLDVDNCTLRHSGGVTFTPEISPSKGQEATHTSLGYFYAAAKRRSGSFRGDGMIDEAVAPLDPNKRYQQVLMQCPDAESDDNSRVRFLLLAENTLIEVAASSAYGSELAVRHYRRTDKVSLEQKTLWRRSYNSSRELINLTFTYLFDRGYRTFHYLFDRGYRVFQYLKHNFSTREVAGFVFLIVLLLTLGYVKVRMKKRRGVAIKCKKYLASLGQRALTWLRSRCMKRSTDEVKPDGKLSRLSSIPRVNAIALTLWRKLLGVSSGLAIVFAIYSLLMFVVFSTGLFMTHSGDSDFFVSLAEMIGKTVVIFYLLFSAALLLAKWSEAPGASQTVGESSAASDASDAKWAFLFKNISHSTKNIRFILNTILLLGLGCSLTLYGVQKFVDSTPAYANQRNITLPSVFSLKYFFKTGSAMKEDIDAMSTPTHSKSGAEYSVIEDDTIRMYRSLVQQRPVILVEIIGFADAVGSSESNQSLSRRRAETIQALLISAGVPEKMISIRAAGERQIACPSQDGCTSTADRRVDVYFR